ncbi:MAG: DUF368 domain-containing protein, partial [Bdellovibrionales bacterium]|nr:DUF368 domain-containing protein [Bdellovibrionales bacterium]
KFQIKEFVARTPWKFFIILGGGILSAIISFAGIISFLLKNHPAYLFAFFGGLILASAIAVFGVTKFSRNAWLSFAFATVLTAYIVGLNPMEGVSHGLPTLFISGMIAISAMVLPGISGSFLLLLLGQYQFILDAVHDRNLLVVATVAAGCGIGIMLAVHVVNFFLTKFHAVTIAALVGIMVGSLRLIALKVAEGFALVTIDFGPAMVIVGILFVVGFILVSVLDHLQSKANPVFTFFGTSPRAH